MSTLKRSFQRARELGNIDEVLPVLLAAELHVIVGNDAVGATSPEWFYTRSPQKDRLCVTVADSESALGEIEWPKMKISGLELLQQLPRGIEILIIYSDGGDYVSREQLDWYRSSEAFNNSKM